MSAQNNVPDVQQEQTLQLLKIWSRNLPAQPTPLIGRELEVTTAVSLLQRPEVSLLTLVGTPGVGKTRLALQVAMHLSTAFADGIFFLSLAPISDPELLIPTITQTLGLKEGGKEPLLALLKAYLQNKQLLLVLDNFEQIVQAAPILAELLETSAGLKMLVTSREVLYLRAEQQFLISPLALPDLKRLPEIEALPQYAAVALFIQRAQIVKPDFQMTATNARAIAEICTRLDGLPLAIELAAARIKLLSPQMLLTKLDQRLRILTQGPRDLPERQQTLRNTIQWSYDLLHAEEQRIFRQISVFVGGCTLKAAQAVCGVTHGDEKAVDILDGVTALLNKSLLYEIEQEDGEMRLGMLETLREYGLELLAASGEEEVTRCRHAAYYLALAEEADIQGEGAQQVAWLIQLEREHDNLRTALNWLVASVESGNTADSKNTLEMAMRLSGALWRFWLVHGHFSEGRQWFERVLALSAGTVTPGRGKALYSAAVLISGQSDYATVEVLCNESEVLCREVGDIRGLAISLYMLGAVAVTASDYRVARARLEEALVLFREVSYHEGGAWALQWLANVTIVQGDYDRAYALLTESEAAARQEGNKWSIAWALYHQANMFFNWGDLTKAHSLGVESLLLARELDDKLAIIYLLNLLGQNAHFHGDDTTARLHAEECHALARKLGYLWGIANSLALLAKIAAKEAQYTLACNLYEESATVLIEMGDKNLLASCLEGLASAGTSSGNVRWAAQLWGVAESLREAIGAPIPPVERANYEQAVKAARTQLDEQAVAKAWAEGRGMTAQQAFAAKGQATQPEAVEPTITEMPTPPYPAGLTSREVAVLRLVAEGLTNAQIAEKLSISSPTVNAHLRSIYDKLDVSSRIAATRYAIDHKLV